MQLESVAVRTADPVGPVPRRWPPLPTVLLYGCAAVFGLVIGYRFPWSGDTGLHAAVIEQFGRHLTHPPDPLTGAPGPSPYYSPLALAQALVAHAGGFDGRTVLRFTAVLNALLLASGVHHLTARLCTDAPPRAARRAPLLALLSVALLAGPLLLTWSGFTGLASLAVGLSYPSTFALGLALHVWGLTWLALRRPAWWLSGVIGLAGAELVLDHPFTAFGTALGCLALAVPVAGTLTPRRLTDWAAALAVTVAGVLAWPYYSAFGLAASMSGMDSIHAGLYRWMLGHFALPALVGLPALVIRFRRHRLDPLVLLCLAATLITGYGGISGHYAWGRAAAMAVLAAQLAVGIEAAQLPALRSRSLRRVAVAVLVVAALVGLRTQGGTLDYAVPMPAAYTKLVSIRHDWGSYRWLTDRVPADETLLTDDYYVARVAPAYRLLTVAPAYPEPWLAGEHARRADQAAMLDPATSAKYRRQLLHHYRIGWLACSAGRAGALRAAGLSLTEVAHSPDRPQRLYRVG